MSVDFLNPFAGVAVGPHVNADELESDAFTLAESVGLALRETDLASIQLNLMPPELVEQARTIRRIPFIAAGALAFLAALGAGWYAENHLKEVASAQFEAVQAKNGQLKSKEAALKNAQAAVSAEVEECDKFQKLLWQRSAAILRMRAVRESLKQIDGLWITAWEPLQGESGSGRDDAQPKEGAQITIRGWKDVVAKAEDEWAKRNNGQKLTADVIVVDSLKNAKSLFSEVKPEGWKELKGCLMEYKIKVVFAPAPTIVRQDADRKGKAARK